MFVNVYIHKYCEEDEIANICSAKTIRPKPTSCNHYYRYVYTVGMSHVQNPHCYIIIYP